MNENEVNYQIPEDAPNQKQAEQETLPGMRRSFWQRHGATIITLAILGLIIGGAIAVNERRSGNLDLRAGDEQTETPANQAGTNGENNQGQVGSGTSSTNLQPLPAGSAIRVTEERNNSGQIVAVKFEVSALRGEGRTHLARRAITEQMRRSNINLSFEQRVYAEDFLQKRFAPKVKLHPGSVITFTDNQINQAIEASQGLTQAQLKNLEKFAQRVNWSGP